MTIYHVSANGDGEEIFLERWSIRESNIGGRHFVGFDVNEQDGRASTPIVSFDPKTRVGITSTGRQYHLLGKAGFDKDGEYVWNWAVKAWNIEGWKDVTAELCPDWRNPFPESTMHPDAAGAGDSENPPGDSLDS
ncbi:hypothetical protein PQR71_18010 [Paraburkholderia fungorum]|uniref:hypothetical protein n=1 Tax=Paraburkholderia fungorum TaxID=134537 RepID=UPI0038BAEE88